uniref:Uncharacterized protein n=1 Tax=Rhodnius prolixus TaxID=13249 RepID=T1HU49_RHOPR
MTFEASVNFSYYLVMCELSVLPIIKYLNIEEVISAVTLLKLIISYFLSLLFLLTWKIIKRNKLLIDPEDCFKQVQISWLVHVENVSRSIHCAIYTERKTWCSVKLVANFIGCFHQLSAGHFPDDMNFKFIEKGWIDFYITTTRKHYASKKKEQLDKLLIVLLNGEDKFLNDSNINTVYPIQGLVCIAWLNLTDKTRISTEQKYLLLNNLSLERLHTLYNKTACLKCIIGQEDYVLLPKEYINSSCQHKCHISRKYLNYSWFKVLTPVHNFSLNTDNVDSFQYYSKVDEKPRPRDYNNNYIL